MKLHGDFVWVIQTWKSGLKLKKGQCIQSDYFMLEEKCENSVSTHKWYLQFYPNGLSYNDKNTFKLHCVDSTSLEITVKISLLDQKNNKVLSKKISNVCTNTYSSVKFPNFFDENNVDEEIEDLLKDLLKEDKIVILCEITINQQNYVVIKSRVNSIELESCEILKLTVEPDKFEQLLITKTCSDVIFKILDKEIHLHKIILLSKSPVFAAMFEHDMQENRNNEVEIVDFEYKVFKEMLRFIYTGKVNAIEFIADKLIVAADKYCIEDLKKECEVALLKNITLDNVVVCLELAVNCNTILLKNKVIEFVLSNKKVVLSKPEFKLLVKKDPDVMLEVIDAIANST